ncbi:unnamed protein product [Brachionus calyciflorus]|uniref:WD repeat-containing protein 91 n=1 Tax=Brachionus calyciflorus TaxID=104777 RepID=A0A813WXA8_9BILA|nr:unnamed protein product [Brachionus calyciflorus]
MENQLYGLSATSSTSYTNIQTLASNQSNGSMSYMDELIKEYLLFRGFNSALKSFEHDIKSDKDKMFRPDKLTDLFLTHIHQYELASLLDLWSFLEFKYFSRITIRLNTPNAITRKYELFLLRYYLVNAIQNNKTDKVFEFFENYASKLQSQVDWKDWFCLPFTKNPEDSPQFSVYFNKNWIDTFIVSFQNFLTIIFQSIQFPNLLTYNEEAFWFKNSFMSTQTKMLSFDSFEQDYLLMELNDEFHEFKNNHDDSNSKTSGGFINLIKNLANNNSNKISKKFGDKSNRKITMPSINDLNIEDRLLYAEKRKEKSIKFDDTQENTEDSYLVLSQNDYKEHTTEVIFCKFSYDGKYIASIDSEGIVKIWLAENESTPIITTIVTKTLVVSIEWERRNSNIIYIGLKSNAVKIYDLLMRKFIQELSLNKNYPFTNLIHSTVNTNKLIVLQHSTVPNVGSQFSIYESNLKNNCLSLWKNIDFNNFKILSLVSLALNNIIFGCYDGFIRRFDYDKQQMLICRKCHDGPVLNLKINIKENILISVSPTEATLWTLNYDIELEINKKIELNSCNLIALDSTENYLVTLEKLKGCNLIYLNSPNSINRKVNCNLDGSSTFDLYADSSNHINTLVIGNHSGLIRIFKLMFQY